MIYLKNNPSYARGCPQLLQTASFLHKDYLLHFPVHRNPFRCPLEPAAFNWYFRKVIPPASFRQIYPHETASRYSFSSSLILSASCFWQISPEPFCKAPSMDAQKACPGVPCHFCLQSFSCSSTRSEIWYSSGFFARKSTYSCSDSPIRFAARNPAALLLSRRSFHAFSYAAAARSNKNRPA